MSLYTKQAYTKDVWPTYRFQKRAYGLYLYTLSTCFLIICTYIELKMFVCTDMLQYQETFILYSI